MATTRKVLRQRAATDAKLAHARRMIDALENVQAQMLARHLEHVDFERIAAAHSVDAHELLTRWLAL